MATLDDADIYLIDVENIIRDLKSKYDSKQSERLISSHVWMSDHIDRQVKPKVLSFKDALTTIKDRHVGDFKSTTQFDTVITFCNDLLRLLDNVNTMYKMRANYIDIKLKWQYNLPQMLDKIQHMRNRFNIIKGQITQKKKFEYEEDNSWF